MDNNLTEKDIQIKIQQNVINSLNAALIDVQVKLEMAKRDNAELEKQLQEKE